ncbi:MAG: ImmA/IrrE family metallo-endopeptidase [Candidatus Paceibacterota bacterium]
MLNKDFKAPFLGNIEIRYRTETFRRKFWNNSIPVNIEDIIDITLKINVIPVPNLIKFCDTDALIASNWKSIYVDKNKYLDERYTNRLRFSFAHEIGHFVLHKEIYKSFSIKSFEDFYKLIDQIPQEQYGYIETQANKFANYLLIPRDILSLERNKLITNEKTVDQIIKSKKIDDKTIDSYIAIPLSKIFCVSEDAMEIALSDIRS